MSQNMQTASDNRVQLRGTVAAEGPRRIASGELLRGERRVIIEHEDADYTLLLTRNGKLILTK
jgi:hemin uptake protein HemP